MLLLVVGVIVGALAAALRVSISSRHRLRALRRQNALLRSRLHSLLAIAEHAARQVDDPDVLALLQETRAQLTADHLIPPREQPPAAAEVASEDDIPPIFPRHSS